jgi:RNA recognition motif-containing protein
LVIAASAFPAGQRLTPQKILRSVADVFNFFSFVSRVHSMTKLYVGNLSFGTTEDSLRALFAQHGTVESAKLIADRDTGRPRGFGFVEMPNADASNAMQALNGRELDGRALRVNEAREMERSGAPREGRRY